MFIIIQFPFVDLRLLDKHTYKDTSFLFPNQLGNLGKSPIYYHYFGYNRFRYNFDQLPSSEHSFFQNQKLLKMVQTPDYKYKLVFTRLFTDDFFFHFDIGIRVTPKNNSDKINVAQLIGKLLTENIFTTLGSFSKHSNYSFLALQQYIASLYVYATTNAKNPLRNNTSYLYFGKPAIYCQYSENKCRIQNNGMVQFDIDQQIRMYKSTRRCENSAVHLWLTSKPDSGGDTIDMLRRLRICILKLHNYREGLDGVFQYLKRNEYNCHTASELLIQQFTYLLGLLERDKHFGIGGKQIMDLAIEKEKVLYYDSWEENLSKIKFYLSKIEAFRNQKMEVKMGDIYIAKQVGAQGQGAGANSTYNQEYFESNTVLDYAAILRETGIIKHYLRNSEVNDNNDILMGELSQINKSAEQKDDKRILSILGSIGNQIIDITKRTGCSVLAGIISSQLGL